MTSQNSAKQSQEVGWTITEEEVNFCVQVTIIRGLSAIAASPLCKQNEW